MSDHLRLKLTEKKTVLVVDDEPINRELLRVTLDDEYDVVTAEDGETALKQAERRADDLSVILLDLMMPGISGIEVLQRLKDSPKLSRIPVIVMTADQDAEVASLNLGALDFIRKPYPKRDIILARIRRTIELSEDRNIIRSTERDPLTGLYNREYFYNYAETFDLHHKDAVMDAIVLDINHFHLVNERYGRTFADQVLCHTAAKLLEMVQETGGIVCRRGGDTFLVYCPHREEYAGILERVSEGLESADSAEGSIRFRLGVYPEVDKDIDLQQRFDRAKSAADTVRANYSQNIGVYDRKFHESELFADQLAGDFDRAIREHQFMVVYQPKFDIRADVPVLAGAEALVRWNHPTLGFVSPGAFIPLFEENGLVGRLDRYVWEETARQMREWKDRFGFAVPVSVNVSRTDLADDGLTEVLTGFLVRYGLAPAELLLEITESAYTEDSRFVITRVNELRARGMKVQMDDFGTGYSSLGMIAHLPVDALKLDMTFVRNAFGGQGDTRMLELILDIAEYLHVPVIAEGVETKEQVSALKSLGCEMVQGFYFSKPVPAAQFDAFLAERARGAGAEPEPAFAAGTNARAGDGATGAAGEGAMGEGAVPASDVVAAAAASGADAVTDAAADTADTPDAATADASDALLAGEEADDSFTYARLAQALAADYFSIYYVDVKTDHYIEFTAHDAFEDLGIDKEGDDFFDSSRANVLRIIWPEDVQEFLRVFTKENVLQDIAREGSFTVTYRLIIDGEPTYVALKATAMPGEEGRRIVVGVNNVDGEVRRRQESVTYASIAEALAADYFSIYYVDVVTDKFIEYSSHSEYESLNIEKGGDDFFGTSRTNVSRVMYPDDQPIFLEAFTKENLLRELDLNGTFTLSYRLLFDGNPTWVSMKASRMADKRDPHIVIGVNNVDAQVRREHSFAEDLESARTAALRDPLTGVKSKLAFTEAEEELNEWIAAGVQGPFAVAVCDVNGLKAVNDTLGHKAGDRFIREACSIVCDQFKHSPVYRVGGDEFVAILQGADYEHRESILAQFEELNRLHREDGGVVVACGLAEWGGSADERFEDVFERADTVMYGNKKRLKG